MNVMIDRCIVLVVSFLLLLAMPIVFLVDAKGQSEATMSAEEGYKKIDSELRAL